MSKKWVCLLLALALGLCAVSAWAENAAYTELKAQDWDAKPVAYQFLNDRFDGYGAYWPVCLNLYEDGTAASWQATVTGFHVTHWAIEDKYVLWDFYGTWEQTDDGIRLTMNGEAFDVISDFGTNTTPETLEYTVKVDENGKGVIEDYVLLASVGANLTGAVSSDGTVPYATLEDFFQDYQAEYVEE